MPARGTAQCTTSRRGRKLSRAVAEDAFERVRASHQTEPYQKAMRKRKVWVEPLFAEAKDWHGLRRFRLRRLWRVNCEARLDCLRPEPQATPQQTRLGTAPAAQRGSCSFRICSLVVVGVARTIGPGEWQELKNQESAIRLDKLPMILRQGFFNSLLRFIGLY
jgi:hypothetical protein